MLRAWKARLLCATSAGDSSGEGPKQIRELYNLEQDTGEAHDLAREQPDKVKELEALLAKFAADDQPGKSSGKGE